MKKAINKRLHRGQDKNTLDTKGQSTLWLMMSIMLFLSTSKQGGLASVIILEHSGKKHNYFALPGYIRQRPDDIRGGARPPSPTFDVNPPKLVKVKPATRSHNSEYRPDQTFVEIVIVEQVVTAELFTRFSKRTVGDLAIAFANMNVRSRGHRMQWSRVAQIGFGLKLPANAHRLEHAICAFVFGPSVFG